MSSYYLFPHEYTMIGVEPSEESAINRFLNLIDVENNEYYNTARSLDKVDCSDVYHSKVYDDEPENIYFGIYYAPKFVYKFIKELNKFFKYWNIEVIESFKYKMIEGRYTDTYRIIPYDETENNKFFKYDEGNYCLSILFRVIPTKSFRKKKYFRDIFYHTRLYMHHIMRICSLSHGNYIDNNYKTDNYLDYILRQSRNTAMHDYNLCEREITRKDLEVFNNYMLLRKVYIGLIKECIGHGALGEKKILQTPVLNILNKPELIPNLKEGDKVIIKKPITIDRYVGLKNLIIDRRYDLEFYYADGIRTVPIYESEKEEIEWRGLINYKNLEKVHTNKKSW